MTIFRWKNTYADVCASKNGLALQIYFDDVVVPAVLSLQGKLEKLRISEDPGDVFVLSDIEDIFRRAKMAFALAIHAIWENQFRDYLRRCAHELKQDGWEEQLEQSKKPSWKTLESVFLKLRGVKLSEFPSHKSLYTLQLLGNASRHGQGYAAKELSIRCPHFWPPYHFQDLNGDPIKPNNLPIDGIDISLVHLRELVDDVIQLWQDFHYIYMESLNTRHQSAEKYLNELRAKRIWFPLGEK